MRPKHHTLNKKTSQRLFNQANKQHDAGNFREAFILLKKAVEQGESYAANSLGYYFDKGIGTAKNEQKAMFWYKKAARSGDACAYANIGTIYRDHKRVDRARFWFTKAFKNGDGDAALELGKLFLKSKKKAKLAHAEKYLRLTLRAKNVTQDSKDEAELLLKSMV